jgi:hypothetical protein
MPVIKGAKGSSLERGNHTNSKHPILWNTYTNGQSNAIAQFDKLDVAEINHQLDKIQELIAD